MGWDDFRHGRTVNQAGSARVTTGSRPTVTVERDRWRAVLELVVDMTDPYDWPVKDQERRETWEWAALQLREAGES